MATIVLTSGLAGQQLEPGARVRVHQACASGEPCEPIIGTLRRMTADSIELVETDRTLHALPLTSATQVEVSHGFRRRHLEGLAAGFLGGAAVGTVGQLWCGRGNTGDDSICGLWMLVAIPPAMLIGTIVGGQYETESWVTWAAQSVLIAPTGDGWWLGMRLTRR